MTCHRVAFLVIVMGKCLGLRGMAIGWILRRTPTEATTQLGHQKFQHRPSTTNLEIRNFSPRTMKPTNQRIGVALGRFPMPQHFGTKCQTKNFKLFLTAIGWIFGFSNDVHPQPQHYARKPGRSLTKCQDS